MFNFRVASFTIAAFSGVKRFWFQQTNWQVSKPISLAFLRLLPPSSREAITPNFSFSIFFLSLRAQFARQSRFKDEIATGLCPSQ